MIKKVHQIVFSTSETVELEGYALTATQSVRDAFRDHEYHMWHLDEAAQFIQARFDPEVLATFHHLTPFSYKADLFKFCLLRSLGGWIVDVGVTMLKTPLESQLEAQDPRFVVFRSSGPWDASWNCSMALAYAKPGHVALDTAMGWVVENCHTRLYGANPLSPTMTNFGRALAHHSVQENVKIGAVVDVHGLPYRRGFELPPLGIVAARKPPRATAGVLDNIGVPGTNNYVDLWRQRQVYGEDGA